MAPEKLPETIEFARNFSVMVRVQGPDPKGVKMRKHAFHHYMSGATTLSASGFLLPHSVEVPISWRSAEAVVVTVGSIVEPFLGLKYRESFTNLDWPELIPSAQIDVMVEGKMKTGGSNDEQEKGSSQWLAAEVIALVDVPASSFALQSLLTHGSWEIGWSLGSLTNDSQTSMDATQTQFQVGHGLGSVLESSTHTAMSNTRLAFLRLPQMNAEDLPDMSTSRSNRRGDFLFSIGSPFGILSPVHFLNSISMGSISNSYPANSSNSSLLMADMRCLPGMEGAPVFGENAHLIGILSKPLRQKAGGAEIQLVIPWEAIKKAHKASLQDHSQNLIYPSPVEKVIRSIALITVDGGTWASGVILNEKGLVLTNAHLFEPWRFGKATIINEREDQSELINRTSKRIQVRLDHIKHSVWVGAKVVYVSKGPLDVALLQLQPLPSKLVSVVPELGCPPPGSKAYVIGHGLFGPKCDLYPSTTAGVVSSVVNIQRPAVAIKPDANETRPVKSFPAMLQTTAAVHPGGSGGAVVNSDGHMIGLVTSNARHGGGTVIPHLNFSIPAEALSPIFKFSQDMQNLSLLQDLDKPNEQLSSVWALTPPLLPRTIPLQPPHTPVDDESKSKGSRFAKFIAEKGNLLLKPSQIIKEKNSHDMISSKL